MKTNTKKTFFIVLCVCVIACVCGITMKTTQKDRLNGNYVASGFVAYAYEEADSNVLGDTKYNISTNKVGDDNYLLIVTHLKNPDYVYELGYDFDGTYSVQEGDRASTNTYYTSITTLSNTTYYADDIFEDAEHGDAMIVWEIKCNSTSNYTYHAYAKVGMLDGGEIYAYKDERIDTGKPYATAFYQVSIRIDENSIGFGSIDVTEISEVPYGAPVSVVGNKLTVNGTTVTATPANDNYAFEMFIGHSATITEDTTILVSFNRAYTVTFENYDGTTLYSTKVLENEIPEYRGAEPEKKTVVSAYTFDGWDKEIVAASENTTYTAQFTGGQLAYTAVYGNDEEWDQTVNFKTDGTVVLLPVNIGGTYTVTPESGGQSGTIAITWTNAWSGTDVGTYKVVNGSAIIRIYFASAEASFVLYDDKCIDDAKVNDVSIKHNGSAITEYVHTEDSLNLTDFTFGMPEGVNNYTVSWYIDGVANTMTDTAYEFATTGEFLLTAFAVRGNTVYVASITITVPSIYDLFAGTYTANPSWGESVIFNSNGNCNLSNSNWVSGTYTLTPASENGGTIDITWTSGWSGTDTGTYAVVNGNYQVNIYLASAETYYTLYNNSEKTVGSATLTYNGADYTGTKSLSSSDELDLTKFGYSATGTYTAVYFIDGELNAMTDTAFSFSTVGRHMISVYLYNGDNVAYSYVLINVVTIYDLFAGTYTTNPSWDQSVVFNSNGTCNLSPASDLRGTYVLTPVSENGGTIAITWSTWGTGTDTGTYAVVNGTYQVNIYLDNAGTYYTLYNNSEKTVGSATLTYNGEDYTGTKSLSLSDELDLTQFGYSATGTYTAVYFIDGELNAMTDTAFSFDTLGRHMISVYLYNGNNVAYSYVLINVVSIYDLFAGTYTTNPSWDQSVVFNSNGTCNLFNATSVAGTYTLTPGANNGGTITINWNANWSNAVDIGTYAVVNGNYQVNIYLDQAATYYTLYNNSGKTVGSATLTYNGEDYTAKQNSFPLSGELDLTKFGYSATGTYTAVYLIDGVVNAMTDTAFSFSTEGRHMISVYIYNGNNVAYSYVEFNVVDTLYSDFAGTYIIDGSDWGVFTFYEDRGCSISVAGISGTYTLNDGVIQIVWTNTWAYIENPGTYSIVNGKYQIEIVIDWATNDHPTWTLIQQ